MVLTSGGRCGSEGRAGDLWGGVGALGGWVWARLVLSDTFARAGWVAIGLSGIVAERFYKSLVFRPSEGRVSRWAIG